MRAFVVEMMMAAVSGMCRWLIGNRLPWQYRFNRTQPRHIEQFAVHLGTDVRFGDYFDAMIIDSAWLDCPWPHGSAMAVAVAVDEVERQLPPRFCRRSLRAALYDYLWSRLGRPPCIEQASRDFGASPATFKRRLAQLGTHYQAELDQVRTHFTLVAMCRGDSSNARIAADLGFHDGNNFRRSFKRWTGATPSVLRNWMVEFGSGC